MKVLVDLVVWLIAAAEFWWAHHLYADGSFFWAAAWVALGIQTCVRSEVS